jgi:uncharacterized protein
MKYLVLLAVLAVAYLLWRNARLARPPGRRPGAAAPGPQEMVSCAVCSVHLPRTDAVAGSGGRLYCSDEHRLTAER